MPNRNNTALKIAIAKYGTAAVSINTNPMTFKFYGWGIYDDPKCGKIDLVFFCSNTGSVRDDPYWTSRKNSLELIELSSINKVV